MNDLYAHEIKRQLFALYECLVRHDENIAALDLLEKATPFFLKTDEEFKTVLAHQRKTTAHLRDEAVYRDYYGNNPHEVPFEEMYAMEVDQISEKMSRIRWLIHRLRSSDVTSAWDLACNDGAISSHVSREASVEMSGFDLNPDCVDRACERGINANYADILRLRPIHGGFGPDAVIAMEVIEHVPDPIALLQKCKELTSKYIYITCPLGATDPGRDDWYVDEFKGHVRAILPPDIVEWAKEVGLDCTDLVIADGHTICAELTLKQ